MKRGYLWVDWVELGCRGWHIDESGAGLYGLAAGQLGPTAVVDLDGSKKTDSYGDQTVRRDWDYCHLDCTTLNFLLAGSRDFMARVLNDLFAAGLIKRVTPETAGITNTYTHDSDTLAVSHFSVWWAQAGP